MLYHPHQLFDVMNDFQMCACMYVYMHVHTCTHSCMYLLARLGWVLLLSFSKSQSSYMALESSGEMSRVQVMSTIIGLSIDISVPFTVLYYSKL